MANTFILTFDRLPEKSYVDFHKEFTGDPDIDHWWHYIKSCYIIVTDLSVGDLSSRVHALFEKHDLKNTHLVLRVDLTVRQGMLTEDAWKWIREHAKP